MKNRSIRKKLFVMAALLSFSTTELYGASLPVLAAEETQTLEEEGEDGALDTVAAASQDIDAEGASQDAAALEEELAVTALGASTGDTLVWNIGIAAVSEFIPGGAVLAPLLTAFSSLYGAGGEDVSNEELAKEIKDVSQKISGLSKEIQSFRGEMNTKLDQFEKDMSDEIESALNGIKNDIFKNGVGAELDILHTQVSGRNGIANKVDVLNGDTKLTDAAKAIEIAYLIGDNKNWAESNNALYRFRLVGDLLAGETYRDTSGRNLYEVLYADASSGSMMTGEAYKKMEPYVDRVVYEYFNAYTTLAQCLSASLEVSQMTDDEVQAMNDAALYRKYQKSKVLTSLVKKELDELNEQLLDPKNSKSVISMYAAFKHKESSNSTVYINKGASYISLAADVESAENAWTGKRQHNEAADEGIYSEYQSDWYTKEAYQGYYQELSDFVSGGEHLAPDAIRVIGEHLKSTSSGTSLVDYLSDCGFQIGENQKEGACFATSGLKSKSQKGTNAYSRSYGFDTIQGSEAAGNSSWVSACDLSLERTGLPAQEDADTKGVQAESRGSEEDSEWVVYAALQDVSYLGLRIVSNEDMPETAEEVLQKEHSDYTAVIGSFDSSFELYQGYDLSTIPVTFQDGDGNTISKETLQADSEGDFYRFVMDDPTAVWMEGYALRFRKAGTYQLTVTATDPEGNRITSEPAEIICREQHRSTSLTADQTRNNTKPLVLVTDFTQSFDLNALIGPQFSRNGSTATVTPVWESLETPKDGVLLSTDGTVVFRKKGSFSFRFKGKDGNGDFAYSDWNEVLVKDSSECFTVIFHEADGSELYRITGKEGESLNSSLTAPDKEGYVFTSWDKHVSEDGGDGEADELPDSIPGEHTRYSALWSRVQREGYTSVSNAEELAAALSSAAEGDTLKLALTRDITVKKLDFPKITKADIEIDGVEHTLSFEGAAKLLPKGEQSLTLVDLGIAAEKNGKEKEISITAAQGGLSLDSVLFSGKKITIQATKGDLAISDQTANADRITIKGNGKTTLTTGEKVLAKAVTGFGVVQVKSGRMEVGKTFKVGKLSLSSGAVLGVPKGAAYSFSGISGTGTMELSQGFTPVTLGQNLGQDNSDGILLSSEQSLENQVIFKSKAPNLNQVFQVEGISPEVTDGSYRYGLYTSGGKVTLRDFRISCNGALYCEWADCMKAIASEGGEAALTLLGDLELLKNLTFPGKGKYEKLTINGQGYRITFSGKNVSLTGDTELNDVSLKSAKGTWTLKKGTYSLTGSSYSLEGEASSGM